MHSSISEQIGSFSNPSLHSHIKLPIVFKQFALVPFPSPQFPLFSMHSSMSEQIGSFSKPSLQLHIKLPIVFKQFALVPFPSPQFPLFSMHSSMSLHTFPVP